MNSIQNHKILYLIPKDHFYKNIEGLKEKNQRAQKEILQKNENQDKYNKKKFSQTFPLLKNFFNFDNQNIEKNKFIKIEKKKPYFIVIQIILIILIFLFLFFQSNHARFHMREDFNNIFYPTLNNYNLSFLKSYLISFSESNFLLLLKNKKLTLNENIIFRQIRTKKINCQGNSKFFSNTNESDSKCIINEIDEYPIFLNNKSRILEYSNGNIFNMNEIIKGEYQNYPSGGYFLFLNLNFRENKDEYRKIIMDENFIQKNTKAIIINFNLENQNNEIVKIDILFEFSPLGILQKPLINITLLSNDYVHDNILCFVLDILIKTFIIIFFYNFFHIVYNIKKKNVFPYFISSLGFLNLIIFIFGILQMLTFFKIIITSQFSFEKNPMITPIYTDYSVYIDLLNNNKKYIGYLAVFVTIKICVIFDKFIGVNLYLLIYSKIDSFFYFLFFFYLAFVGSSAFCLFNIYGTILNDFDSFFKSLLNVLALSFEFIIFDYIDNAERTFFICFLMFYKTIMTIISGLFFAYFLELTRNTKISFNLRLLKSFFVKKSK